MTTKEYRTLNKDYPSPISISIHPSHSLSKQFYTFSNIHRTIVTAVSLIIYLLLNQEAIGKHPQCR